MLFTLIILMLFTTPAQVGVCFAQETHPSTAATKYPILALAINPLDCPACLLGYQKIKEDVMPHFKGRIKFFLPEEAKYSAAKIFKDRLNENYKYFQNCIVYNDSLQTLYLHKNMSSVLILIQDSVLWQQSIKDFTAAKENTKPILINSFDLPDSIYSKSSTYEFINDSTWSVLNPLKGSVTLYNLPNMSTLLEFSDDDTSLMKLAYRSLEDIHTREYNLKYLEGDGSLTEKYGFNPMQFLNLTCYDQVLWISIKLLVVKQDISDPDKLSFYPCSFLLSYDMLSRKTLAYSLPYCFNNSNVCPYPIYFSFIDRNKILVPNSTANHDSLFSVFSINKDKLTLETIIPFSLPEELPKRSNNGMPIFYMPVLLNKDAVSVYALYKNGKIYDIMNPSKVYTISCTDSLFKAGSMFALAASLSNHSFIIGYSSSKHLYITSTDQNFNCDKTYKMSDFDIYRTMYHQHLKIASYICKRDKNMKLNTILFL